MSFLSRAVLAGLLLAGVTGATLISIPQWGDATLIELLWFLTGVMMILISTVYSLPRVYGDYVLTTRVPGAFTAGAVILAYGRIRREVVRIAQGFIVLTIGAWACLTPSPLPGPAVISLTGLVLTIGLFLLGLLTALQSVLDRRDATHVEDVLTEVLVGSEGTRHVQGLDPDSNMTESDDPNDDSVTGTIKGKVAFLPDE